MNVARCTFPSNTTAVQRLAAARGECIDGLRADGPSASGKLALQDGLTSAAGETRPGWTLDPQDGLYDGAFVGAGGEVFSSSTPLSQVPPVLPNNGASIRSTLFFVNGIMTDVALQLAGMQSLANRGFGVIGIHNSTEGFLTDLGQCLGDKLGISDNKATRTLSQVMDEYVRREQPLQVAGHSQGALIASNAVGAVEKRLQDDGLSDEQVREKLGLFQVSTLGAAASTYPEGPHYVHYHNKYDVLSALAGRQLPSLVSKHKNEEFRNFSVINEVGPLPPASNGWGNVFARAVDQSVHGVTEVYAERFASAG